MLEKLLKKKRTTALLFVFFLFAFSAVNMKKELPFLWQAAVEWYGEETEEKEVGELTGEVTAAVTEQVAGKHGFVDAYGYVQLLLGKEEEGNFETVKDREGKLHYTYFAEEINDTEELARRAGRLSRMLEAEGTKLLCVMPPDKFIAGHTRFSAGLPYHMANETADDFLRRLEGEDVKALDLRKDLADSGLEMSRVFFRTDHHWRTETAFWAASRFCDWMGEAYGEEMDPEGYFKEPGHYRFITYENAFLGSMGRKTGRLYAGTDDFTLIFPKFSTDYRYRGSSFGNREFSGRFEEVLIDGAVLRDGRESFATDFYGAYLYGNPGFTHIENRKRPDGPEICFVKDSFAVPFAAFVSLRCRTVDLIDPRAFEGDYTEVLKDGGYDYVILMFSPQNLTEEFFSFCEEEQDA